MLFWAWWSHGSVSAWVRYLTFIFTHEDTDVAILPTAVRDFSFHWSGVQTLAASVVGGLAAAASLMRPAVGRDEARHAALSFLLLCAWVELVTTTVTLNYTFTIGEYIALPLFGVVVSWPREWRVVPRAVVAAGVAALLAADLGVLAYRYSAIFLTWDARNPDALNAFVDRYVPPGSAVVGPEAPFFFPVERSGSRYRTMSPRSWADWARWVPLIEPEATLVVRRFPRTVPRERFVIWVKDDALPDEYACANAYRVATFESAPPSPLLPDWMGALMAPYPGYPSATLYRLPPGCPDGYDPTRPPGSPSESVTQWRPTLRGRSRLRLAWRRTRRQAASSGCAAARKPRR